MTDKSGHAATLETRGAAPDVIYLPDLRQRTKKITSGSDNRQRKAGVFVRLLPEESARLAAEAASAGFSVPAYLVAGRLGDDATPPRMRRRSATVDVAALSSAFVCFKRGTTLLNQATHAANGMALFAEVRGCDRLIEEVGELRRGIDAIKESFAAPLAAIIAALSDDSEG
jgi:hypothetical protein